VAGCGGKAQPMLTVAVEAFMICNLIVLKIFEDFCDVRRED
jgi:hypothetical protein